MPSIERIRTRLNVYQVAKLIVQDLCGEEIGQGAYGIVYKAKLDKNLVIRISMKDDVGYRKFVELILSQKEPNPHFPKIYRAIRYSNGLFVVVMEKLRFLERRYDRRSLRLQGHTSSLIDDVIDHLMIQLTFVKAMKTRSADKSIRRLVETRKKLNELLGMTFSERPPIQHALPPILYDACWKIADIVSSPSNKVSLDIHSENIMWRMNKKNPILVITDPLC